MDYFFAAVEEKLDPSLKGKPVVVGADPKKGRGVVSTANYEARKYGIKSGMPITRAYKLCPQAVFLPVRHERYEEVSERIMEILKKYADRFEQISIDEAFLDISSCGDWDRARKLAERIKEEIRRKEGLTCSIGIGPNKLIAKLASEAAKPDGIKVVKPEDIRTFLEPLPVRKIWGIGPVTARLLREHGIRTVRELAEADLQKLAEIFGRRAWEIHQLALGIDESPVQEEWEVKSVSREHTFERDLEDEKRIMEKLDELSEDAWEWLKENGFLYRTVCVKVRYSDFETHTHQKTDVPHSDLEFMKERARELLKPFLGRKPIRLIGIRISGLVGLEGQKRIKEYF